MTDRTVAIVALLALVHASCAGLLPPARDAGTCAAAQAASFAACDPQAPDPLADHGCADALRGAVRACAVARDP